MRFAFFYCLCSDPKGYVMFRPIYERHVTPKHNTVPMNFLTMTNDCPCCGFSGIADSHCANIYCLTSTTNPMAHHEHYVIRFCLYLKNQPVEPTIQLRKHTHSVRMLPYMCVLFRSDNMSCCSDQKANY
jgi:hypothetical protein